MRWRGRRTVTPHEGWMSHLASGLALAGFLAFFLAYCKSQRLNLG